MLYTDLHTHGISGHDARSANPETYLRMAGAMFAHGTGAFLPTLFPGQVHIMRAQMDAVKRAMETQARDGVSGSARILGVHLEGPFVNPAKCGALDKDEFIPPTLDNLARLTDGFTGIIKIITVAPELPGAIEVIEAATGLGMRVNMGHSAATFDDTLDGRAAGATGVTHLFNAMSGLHHREPGLAGYALYDDTLYVEVIADMAHVHPAVLRLVLMCKPPDRVILVSDSLAPAKTPGVPETGPMYMPDGLTLAGSGISLADAVANVASLGLPGVDAGRLASVNPLSYIGMRA